jgi:uncharacterized protein YhaN
MSIRLDQQVASILGERNELTRQTAVNARARYREFVARYAEPHEHDAKIMVDDILPLLKLSHSDIRADIKALGNVAELDVKVAAENDKARQAMEHAKSFATEIERLCREMRPRQSQPLKDLQTEALNVAQEHGDEGRKLDAARVIIRRNAPRMFSAAWIDKGI